MCTAQKIKDDSSLRKDIDCSIHEVKSTNRLSQLNHIKMVLPINNFQFFNALVFCSVLLLAGWLFLRHYTPLIEYLLEFFVSILPQEVSRAVLGP